MLGRIKTRLLKFALFRKDITTMKLTRLPLLIAAAAMAVAIGGAKVPAYAGSGTFAEYDQSSTGNAYQFFNKTGAFDSISSANTPGPTPVNFEFLVHTSFGPANTQIAATLTMVGTTTSGITNVGTTLNQPIDSLSYLFKTVGPNPVTLLTVTIENTTLSGQRGGSAASLYANQGISNGTGVTSITYASTFVNFTGTGKNNASMNFTGLGNFSSGSNGFLNNFKAGGGGSFAASHAGGTGPVPEAGTVVSFGLLLGMGALFLFKRNRD